MWCRCFRNELSGIMWEVTDSPIGSGWRLCDKYNCCPTQPGIYYLWRGGYVLDETRRREK